MTDTTVDLAELVEAQRLAVIHFSLPPSKQNFTKTEKALLRKYGFIGPASRADKTLTARAYCALDRHL